MIEKTNKTPLKKSSKVVKTLKILTTKELDDLKLFMQNRFFVKENTEKVLEELLWLITDLDSPFFTWEDISSRAFPEKPFNRKKLQEQFTKICKLIEDFTVYRLVKENKGLRQRLKTISLQDRVDFLTYEKLIDQALTALEEDTSFLTDFDRQAVLQLQHYYPSSRKESDSSPFEANQSLDKLYALQKLRFYCENSSRTNIWNDSTNFTFPKETLAIAATFQATHPLIALYLDVIDLYENNSECKLTIFQKIKKTFCTQQPNLLKTDQHIIYRCLVNFTIQQLRYNKMEYGKPQLELYQFGLDHHLLSPHGNLSHIAFFNLVNTAIGLREFDLAEYFIEQHHGRMQVQYRIDYKNLATTYFFFYQKKYEQAQRYFNRIPRNKKIFHGVPVRFMELRLLFESFLKDTKHYKPIINSNINSFLNFLIKESDLQEERKQTYHHFLDFLILLKDYLLSEQPTASALFKKQLIRDIQATNPLIAKAYLIEKVRNLE